MMRNITGMMKRNIIGVITALALIVTALGTVPGILPSVMCESAIQGTDGTGEFSEELMAPSGLYGTSTKKGIRVRWTSVRDVDGYILWRNGKKVKTLKASVKSYTDTKVKKNRKYRYRIQAYRKADEKKKSGKKSYQITVVSTNAGSKKLNAARFTGVKKSYGMANGESRTLKPIVRYSKKIRGKAARGKKVYSKKLVWSSSNPELVDVNAKGKLTVCKDKRLGTAKITARAHNGKRKVITVEVVDFTTMRNVRNLKKVDHEVIKQLLTDPTAKEDTCRLVRYFQEHNPGQAVEFSHGRRKITTEDGGISYEDCVEMSPEIDLDKDIYDLLLKYIDNHYPVRIKADTTYVYIQRRRIQLYGYELFDLAYVFREPEGLDNYQYRNAVYDVVPVADRWYYGKSVAYGSIF